MASSHSDQLTTTTDISQSINNKQAENAILKSKSSQYKEQNVSFNEQFSIIDEHHSVEQSPSIYPAQQTLPPHDMKTLLGPSSSFISLHQLSPTTTFDQNDRLKLEVERLTKELELIKLLQSQQQSHIRASHSDTSCAIVQRPTTTITQLPYSNVNMTPIHIIVNTDPLQQMKDFVKPFNGNPNNDVIK
ncbi:unnamed protein product [Rotaria sp. Silwood1]|nr:unnamed protein product [Rotaria sp. Silwood1]CAF4964478.1 unnamed protein product [Rotaria sp. Silwood1]CAF4994164.1 unnamed protein product [Rotaria sp. Silwood1]